MKILHMISGGDVGGAKTHVHTLLAGLSKTEDVMLVCFMEGPFAEEARSLGIPTQVLTGSLFTVIRTITDMVREQNFQILHCHGSRSNLIGSFVRSRTGLPTITTVHSDYRLDYMGRPLAAVSYGTLNKLALRRMDYWIGVSQPTVQMLCERDFDPNRCFVISNGVPFDLGAPALDRDAYLRSVGIQPEADLTVFGIAARINPVKDMGTLIRAFAKTVAVCPGARLIIAGDGEQRAQMETLAAELCPAGTVAFAGWISDTHSFYSALDVNLLTSLSEGFPYAIAEGASHRCGTIATRVGGIPNLIEHEVNGLLFTPKDVDTLAQYMTRLAQNRPLMEGYAERLYEKAKQYYSVDSTVQRQKEIYETILRRTARAAARKRDGVLICGAYGKDNVGDEAILAALVKCFREIDPDLPLYVTSRSPAATARDSEAGSIYTFHPWKLRRLMRKTALYLSGGGSLIQDATSSRSLWYYLNSIRNAKRRGNQVMLFACGIGPVSRGFNCRQTQRVLSRYVDRITLRDDRSRWDLEKLGVTGVPTDITADLAFLVPAADPARVEARCTELGIAPEEQILILAPRPWKDLSQHLDALADAALYAAKTYGWRPVILAMEPLRDRAVCLKIAERLDGHGVAGPVVVEATGSAGETVGLIRRAEGVIGMRLHALIFAVSQNTPLAGIAYDPKVSGFMNQIGRGECCCSMAQLSSERLRELVDRLPGQSLCPNDIQSLQQRARENCRIAVSLLERRD
ncbi:MAG: polysaccharide pyruvyl transferase CsaB [Oscillospiraceae bacterium]|nr:polysaccharide pyruvyl transferase CsaB [Oscillospiraceae bacterium]